MKHIFTLLSLLCCVFWGESRAQNTAPELPGRSGTASVTQTLNFGDITLSSALSGGTVTVNYSGTRSTTGNVIGLSTVNNPHQAIFEYKLCPGRSVIINYPATVILSGSSGGTLTLHVGDTNFGPSGSVFTSNKGCDDATLVHVGGTVEVGALTANPPGLYTGTFDLTFIQQ